MTMDDETLDFIAKRKEQIALYRASARRARKSIAQSKREGLSDLDTSVLVAKDTLSQCETGIKQQQFQINAQKEPVRRKKRSKKRRSTPKRKRTARRRKLLGRVRKARARIRRRRSMSLPRPSYHDLHDTCPACRLYFSF
jgi:hypothetical protein